MQVPPSGFDAVWMVTVWCGVVGPAVVGLWGMQLALSIIAQGVRWLRSGT